MKDIYKKFIGNFMRAKASMEIAKQSKSVFTKFLEVSCGRCRFNSAFQNGSMFGIELWCRVI